MKLPTVTGRNLMRHKMTFPDDFEDNVNLVFIAFEQWQQAQVDSWIPLAQKLESRFPDLYYYEFPTIQYLNFIARTFINEGMRAGIPSKDARSRTVTLYIDKEPFREALGIPDEDDIWVMLFDKEGRLFWGVRGAYTLEKAKALESAVSTFCTADNQRPKASSSKVSPPKISCESVPALA